MICGPLQRTKHQHGRTTFFLLAALVSSMAATRLSADEPYARSRDYDLQHSKIALRFDLEQKKVIGDVTHSVAILRDGTTKIAFDSVGLTIHGVTLNKSTPKFETTADKLIISLAAAAKAGDRFEISIRYEGKPSKGMYFILPDKDYPDRPKQIWTQGESEDTRYYLPTYDYPNDRLTTETILTVPASWLTVSNGKLISVTDAGKGLKTWYWKEAVPSSTYLITVVAGEFEELKDSWRGIPLSYYAPKGRGDRLTVNYGRTPAMMDLFVRKFGVDYPWEKYAQVMVDDFVAGGMENSSATTNNSSSLVHPKLAPEYLNGEDELISHELAHQWFGDLVTCKDWGNVWLSEGFASFGEILWTEARYGKDEADYQRWRGFHEWFGEINLYNKPIVRHDFDGDADEFDGNAYGKSGWVLSMLRRQIGEDAFYAGLKRYLEANRGKNAVTADFARAVEDATHVNIDEFMGQWIYGAGAPRFELSYAYDIEKQQVALSVKQTQKVERRVGIFRVPVEVEITTESGPKLYPIKVSKANQVFTFPLDTTPLMVLFDKGGQILKSTSFHKEKKEWLHQAKNATEVSDRADAVVALGKIKGDEEIVEALGEVLSKDKFWGVRATAADTLGQLGGAAAKILLDAADSNQQPWLRSRIVTALGNFPGNAAVIEKLEAIAKQDRSYRARAAALQALGQLKTPSASATLEAAVAADSPDGFLRKAALRSFGSLGDDKAVPLLLEWTKVGKPIDARTAAIYSLARLQKDNQEITQKIASYLTEAHFPVRMASIYALGWRGDASAIPALESLLKSADLSIEMVPMIKNQIARLKKPAAAKRKGHADENDESGEEGATPPEKPGDASGVMQRLDKLERLVREMSERLKSMESRLPPPKN